MKKLLSTKIKCLCEHENDVFFRKLKILECMIKTMNCEKCGSIWELTFKNVLKSTSGQYQVKPRGLSITPQCVEIMKEKENDSKRNRSQSGIEINK